MSGFDCISTCAGEVVDVGKTLPRALTFALTLAMFTYLLPLSFSTMATNPELVSNWGDDQGECSWSCIARNIGGEWIMYWVLIACVAGNAGMYIAEMFEDSWQLYGMAESGMAPALFGRRHPKYNTPFNAVLLSYFLICGLVYFDFMDNLSINNFFSCASTILEIFAFLKLRWSRPDLVRPYQIQLGFVGVGLLCALPTVLGIVVLFSCFKKWSSVLMNICAVVVGIGLYFSMREFGGIKYKYDYQRRRMMSTDESEQSATDTGVISEEEEENGKEEGKEQHSSSGMYGTL